VFISCVVVYGQRSVTYVPASASQSIRSYLVDWRTNCTITSTSDRNDNLKLFKRNAKENKVRQKRKEQEKPIFVALQRDLNGARLTRIDSSEEKWCGVIKTGRNGPKQNSY
jgi:hypothetical protein